MSDSPPLNNTENSTGADILARLYFLEGNGQLDASTVNGIISNIVSYGYTVATVQCQQAFVNKQTISIDCSEEKGPLVRNNPNCLECIRLANQVAASRAQLDNDAHALNPSYKIPVLNQAIHDAYYGPTGVVDGVCNYVCSQCVAADTSQSIQMNIEADCNLETDEFRTAFTSGMSLQAETEITQHQAGLANTGLAINKASDITNLAVQMADTIQQMTSVSQINSLKQNAINIQNMAVTADSTSVIIQHAEQAITASMFSSLVSKVYNDTAVQNSINYQEKQQYLKYETEFTDFIKSLSTTVNTIDTLLMNTLGKLIITFLLIFILVIVIFAAIFYFKPDLLFGSVVPSSNKS